MSRKQQRINELYYILVQFEKIKTDPEVTEQSYLSFLDRLYVWYTGYGNSDILLGIEGLRKLGASASHDMVKTSVFHMIDLLNKEGD